MTLSNDTKAMEEGIYEGEEEHVGQEYRPTHSNETSHYTYTVGPNGAKPLAPGEVLENPNVDPYNNNGGTYGSPGMNTGNNAYNPDPYTGLRGSTGETEQQMSDVVDVAIDAIGKAEEAEVKKEETMLGSILGSMSGSIKSGLASLLGKNSNDAEVQAIAQEVETKLKVEVDEELEEDAEEIKDTIVGKIEMGAEMEDEYNVDMKKIEDDVKDHEKTALVEVRQEIDEKAHEIQDTLAFKTAMVEKDILEKRLSNQLGYQVKLTVVNDHVEGVQEALQRGQGQPYGNNYLPGQGMYNPYYGYQPPGGAGYQPQPGGAGYQPQPGGAGYQPQPGGAGYQPQPGGAGYSPQPGGAGYQPQPGGAGYQPQPGGAGYQPQPGGAGYQPQPGGAGYQPQPGGASGSGVGGYNPQGGN